MSESLAPILITLGQSLGFAPRGRVAAMVPKRWPNKMPNAVRLYGLDATDILGTDRITAVVCSVMPEEFNGLTLGVPIVGPNRTQAWVKISNGVPGHDYGVTFRCVLASGLALEENIGLFVVQYPYPVVT